MYDRNRCGGAKIMSRKNKNMMENVKWADDNVCTTLLLLEEVYVFARCSSNFLEDIV